MALDKVTVGVLADNAVTSAKIADGTVVAADIAANSVDSSELVDGSVDLSHMSVNSVDSDQYVDASIDTAHIGNLQVTAAKVASDVATTAGTQTFTNKTLVAPALGTPASVNLATAMPWTSGTQNIGAYRFTVGRGIIPSGEGSYTNGAAGLNYYSTTGLTVALSGYATILGAVGTIDSSYVETNITVEVFTTSSVSFRAASARGQTAWITSYHVNYWIWGTPS